MIPAPLQRVKRKKQKRKIPRRQIPPEHARILIKNKCMRFCNRKSNRQSTVSDKGPFYRRFGPPSSRTKNTSLPSAENATFTAVSRTFLRLQIKSHDAIPVISKIRLGVYFCRHPAHLIISLFIKKCGIARLCLTVIKKHGSDRS